MKKIQRVIDRIGKGSLVGIINGLFGGGAGMIVVPLLKREMDERRAHATALLVVLPVSLFAFVVYLFGGALRMDIALPVALGGAIGAEVGTILLCIFDLKRIGFIFSILMLIAGVWLLL